MKKFVIVLMALALLASGAMADKPKEDLNFTVVGNGTREGGEDIGSAVAIAALPYTDTGDTSDNVDDYQFTTDTAPDVVYSFTPAANMALSVELCLSSYDTKMGIVDGDLNVVGYNDDSCGLQSALYDIPLDAGVTYYIIVDGYGSSSGAYQIDAFEGVLPPDPPANDTCDGAIDLQEQGEAAFTFDMCGATNDYSSPGAGCTGYASNGLDVVYSIDLSAGDTFTVAAQTDYDIAIFLVTDCADMTSCVVGADDTVSEGYETFTYVVEADGTYFLILDGYSSSGLCGEWTVTIDQPVADEDASWGSIKSMYR